MQIADLVDLETLLEQRRRARESDESLPPLRPSARAAASRAVRELRPTASPAARRRAALRAWLDAERARRDDLPGARVQGALRLLRGLLMVAGLLLGVSAAATLLSYDGETPVNVLWFVAVFFGLQIVVLVVAVLLAVGTGRPAVPGVVLWLRDRLARRGLMLQVHRHSAGAGVERWLMFAAAQAFAVWVNLGALATCLFLVTFSDLVFGWATTLQVDAGTAHEIARALAAPWSFLGESWVPDAEVVVQSRWSRMRGAFVAGGVDQEQAELLAAQWWRFLVAGVVTYGLLPRSLAWLLGVRVARRALRRAPFDSAEAIAVHDGLLREGARWDAPAPDTVRGPAPAPATGTVPDADAAHLGGRTAVVRWGAVASADRALLEALAHRCGVQVVADATAGTTDLDADARAVAAVRGATAERVLLLCDAGQQPTKDALHFVTDLRAAIGAELPLAVLLVARGPDGQLTDADPDERAAWQRSLSGLPDTRLAVASLGPD